MPRRREVPKREILPDPKYGSIDLSKFMNVIMESGKKAVAERIIYGALEQVEKKAGKDPLEIFNIALNNVKPMVEVKSRRVGGANYQVPREVRPERRQFLSMMWIIDAARDVRAAAAERGIMVTQGAPATPGVIAPGNIRVVVTRSQASVPSCPDNRTTHGHNFNAGNNSNYGWFSYSR